MRTKVAGIGFIRLNFHSERNVICQSVKEVIHYFKGNRCKTHQSSYFTDAADFTVVMRCVCVCVKCEQYLHWPCRHITLSLGREVCSTSLGLTQFHIPDMKLHAIKLRQFFSTKKIAACLAYFSTRFKSLNQLSNGISRRKKSPTEKVHFFDDDHNSGKFLELCVKWKVRMCCTV